MVINVGDRVKKYNTPREFERGTVIAFDNAGNAKVKLVDGLTVSYPITSLFHDFRA